MQKSSSKFTGISWKHICVCMLLILSCMICRSWESQAYAFDAKDKEDPLYWRYYDEDGNPLSEHEESASSGKDDSMDENDLFSSEAMMGSVSVTNKSLYSSYTSRTYSIKNGTIAHGVDVSKWNDYVDFTKAKNAGVDYVWIRLGYRYSESGGIDEDIKFKTNLKNALEAGMKVGVYFFSQATTVSEAKAEAQFCLNLLGDDLYRLKLPVIMDVEYVNNSGRLYRARLSKEKQTDLIVAFADTIEAKGSKAGVYCSYDFVNRNGGNKIDSDRLEANGISLWIARYNTYLGYSDTDWMAWQYSEYAKVAGCIAGNGRCDVNFMYEDSLPDMSVPDGYCTFEATAVPEDFKATASSSKITLSWSKEESAYGYVVLKRKEGNTNWTRIASIWNADITSIADDKVAEGTVYEYKVSSILSEDGLLRSSYCTSVYSTPKKDAPYFSMAIQTASASTTASVKLSWAAVEDASYYLVYRKDGDGEYKGIAKQTELKYTDTDVKMGGSYTYRVRAAEVMPDGSKVYSRYSTEISYELKPAKPAISLEESEDHSSLSISWKPASDVDGYRIYRKTPGGSYGNYMAKVPVDGSEESCTYVDEDVKMGETYYYKIRAYVKTEDFGTVYSEYSFAVKGYTTPPRVTSLSLTSVRYDRLKLTWEAVEGMDGYAIQKLNADGSRKNVAYVSSDQTSYVLQGLTCGKEATYAVRGYVVSGGEKNYGLRDNTGLTAKPIPTTPTAVYTSRKTGSVTASWNKIAGADGYLIYYKASPDSKRRILAKKEAGTGRSVTVTGKKGSTCYYCVRAYKKVNDKKIYSKFQWVAVNVK